MRKKCPNIVPPLAQGSKWHEHGKFAENDHKHVIVNPKYWKELAEKLKKNPKYIS